MRRRQCALVAVVAVALWPCGCAHSCNGCRCPAGGNALGGTTADSTLKPVERSNVVTDTSAVTSLASMDEALGRPAGGTQYYALTAEDCQCRAAAQSSLGNLLDGEHRILRARGRQGMTAADGIRLRALSAAAQEARNHSASQALQLYYSLAEVEARLDLAQHGEGELEADMRRVKEMRQQGLEVPFDDSEYTRQLAELRSRRIDAEIKRSQANHDLRRLLGMSTEEPDARIWPSTPLTVAIEPIDVAEAVSTGLAMRPELRALRQLTGSVNDENLEAIADVLGSLNGLLGMQPPPGRSRLCGRAARRRAQQAEAPLRRQQLYQYTAEQEHELTEQIRSAAGEESERLRQIALAKETAGNWQKHIAALRAKSTTGQSTFVDIGAARLKSLDADGDVIHAVAAWEIARVKLAELQGQLIAQCDAAGGCAGAVQVLPAIRAPAESVPAKPGPATSGPALSSPKPTIANVAPIARRTNP